MPLLRCVLYAFGHSAELNFRRALDIADNMHYAMYVTKGLHVGVAPTSNILRQSGEFLTFHPNYSIFNQQRSDWTVIGW